MTPRAWSYGLLFAGIAWAALIVAWWLVITAAQTVGVEAWHDSAVPESAFVSIGASGPVTVSAGPTRPGVRDVRPDRIPLRYGVAGGVDRAALEQPSLPGASSPALLLPTGATLQGAFRLSGGGKRALATGLATWSLPAADTSTVAGVARPVAASAAVRRPYAASETGQLRGLRSAADTARSADESRGPGSTPGGGIVSGVASVQSDPNQVSDRVLARANETPHGSPAISVAPSVRRPNVSAGITEPRAGITGIASFYVYIPGGAAAGPALRSALGPGWRGRRVIACVTSDKKRSASDNCVTVTLTDSCQCYGTRLIDLDWRSFSRLAPLSVGLAQVTVEPVQ